KMIGLLTFISDVHGIGLQSAKGLVLASAFYWDLTEETRSWTKRFMERSKKIPTMANAGAYGATLHYLKAIKGGGNGRSTGCCSQDERNTGERFFHQRR